MTATTLGGVPRDRLVDTRLQLHHALQALTSFAQALVDPMDDDRHRNFEWDPGVRGLRTRGVSAAPDTTAVFLVEAFEVRIERDDAVLAVVPAPGCTVDRLRAALQGAARESVPGANGRPGFVPPEFDIPDHAIGAGAPLAPDPDALAELGEWLTHAAAAMRALRGRSDHEVGEWRVWPHHLDMGALVDARGGTVGIGLSLGDEGIPHPYWYVRGYPDSEAGDACPTADGLPTLEHGRWKDAGWTGALLEAPELAGLATREAIDTAVGGFLDTTVPTCVQLLVP